MVSSQKAERAKGDADRSSFIPQHAPLPSLQGCVVYLGGNSRQPLGWLSVSLPMCNLSLSID